MTSSRVQGPRWLHEPLHTGGADLPARAEARPARDGRARRSAQVRPVAFAVDEESGAIDVAGYRNPASQKWRNVVRHGHAAIVVDDVLPPWQPRPLEVRGRAEVLPDEAGDGIVPGAPQGVIRIHPTRILAFGIEEGGPGTRAVASRP